MLILAAVSDFLCDRKRLRSALKLLGTYGNELEQLAERGKAAAALLDATPPEQMRDLFAALLLRIEIGEEHVSLDFRSIELRRFLLWDGATAFRGRPSDWPCSDARYVLDIPVCAISAERWPVVHIEPRAEGHSSRPDRALLKLLGRARHAQRLIEEHRDTPVASLATELRCKPGHFSRLIRLNYLAPDIVTAILDGTQPDCLTRDVLLKANLPMDWSLQRKLFGFSAPVRPIAARNLFGRGMWPSAQKSSA